MNPSLLLRATRPGFLGVTAIACLIGLSSAYHDLHTLNDAVAAVGLLCAVLAHAAANVYNDVGDAEIGSDAINIERMEPFTGGSRLIQQGELSLAEAKRLAFLLALVAILGGLWLVVRCGPVLPLFGVLGIALGFGYSHPRVALMSKGFGEAAVALSWWLIVVGCDYAQRGVLAAAPMVAGASYAVLLACILLANEFPDRPADARVGKNTLVVRLGPRRGIALFAVLMLSAHGWVVMAVQAGRLPSACLWTGVSAVPGAVACFDLWHGQKARVRLRRALVMTQVTAMIHGTLLAAMLLLAA